MTNNDLHSTATVLTGRRAALAGLLAGALLVGAAQGQVSTSVDTVPLQFLLNLHYLSTNYLQVAAYGEGRQLPAQYIQGGEGTGTAGVSATTSKGVSFSGAAVIGSRVREMADEHWSRTLLLRGILRADAVAQTRIDYSPATFTTMFQQAGVIPAGVTFDPYASPTNCLLGLEPMLSVQATVLSALLPSMTNDIAREAVAAMASAAANHATSVRSMLYDLGQTTASVLTSVDQLAGWRDRIDGSSVTDRGLSPTLSSTGGTTTRLSLTDADGLHIGRTPQQALNVLFMTSAAASRGGFFPDGINGGIVRSNAN